MVKIFPITVKTTVDKNTKKNAFEFFEFNFLDKYIGKPITEQSLKWMNNDLKANGFDNYEVVVDSKNINRINIIKKREQK